MFPPPPMAPFGRPAHPGPGVSNNDATQNSFTRALSPPRMITPSRHKMRKAKLGNTDLEYATKQNEAGMRWTKRSGFNLSQIRDFQMLLDLIKPIMIKPDQIQGAREIAQGSFGTIYKAYFNKRAVAVKRINKDRSKPLATKMREAYLELNIMNDLSHPNVVQLVGVSAQFSTDNPEAFYFGIVLELCSDSLQKCLQKKRWGFADRMRMALEMVHGVCYLHSMGVFHRDLSSQNILVTAEHHVKIADFGCARKINERGEYKTTSITGSPAYMAPEQLEGHVLTLKADMWAVGVNLWELATQKLPWGDEAMRESPNQLADYEYCRRKVRNAKMVRPAPGQLNDSVAEPYYNLIMSCHRTDPKLRPSCKDLLVKLISVLSKSSDERLKNAIECTKEMMHFLSNPDGKKPEGQPEEPQEESDALKRRLFKFYRMYNPDKMYEVPQLSKTFANTQEQLNSNLKKRYGVDLTNYPLRTPEPLAVKALAAHARFKSPYANHKPQEDDSSSRKLSMTNDVKKDTLAPAETQRKTLHSQNGRGISVETYGGLDSKKIAPSNDTATTWDQPIQKAETPSALQNAGYVVQGPTHEHLKSESKMEPNDSSQDRTKTILTLMSTIRLLESKNDELLKQRKEVVDNYERDLMKERTRNTELQAQVTELQEQLRLKSRYEGRMSPKDYGQIAQDENLLVENHQTRGYSPRTNRSQNKSGGLVCV